MTSVTGLHVAQRLTEALTAPPSNLPLGPARDSADGNPLAPVVARLREELVGATTSLPRDRSSSPVRLNSYSLSPTRWDDTRPFSWTPQTSRRTIGLSALRDVFQDTGGASAPMCSPSGAVRRTIIRMMAETKYDGAGPRSLCGWLASLPSAALSAVESEATSWTTQLLASLDWQACLPDVTVGAPDRWWDGPAGSSISLRGRADVTIRFAIGSGTGISVLTMFGGRPRPTARAELGLGALVDALRPATRRAIPVRVAGWWPECGRAVFFDVDRALLEETASAVHNTLRHRIPGCDRLAA